MATMANGRVSPVLSDKKSWLNDGKHQISSGFFSDQAFWEHQPNIDRQNSLKNNNPDLVCPEGIETVH